MKRRRFLVAWLVGMLLWGGYLAYRASTNRVTLQVRNMDVRRVVAKLEWQTWERIVLHKNVSGRVTLDVHKVPLEEVLNIVGLQTDARWTALYPIYAARQSALAFRRVVQGDLSPVGSGWSNLLKTPLWQRPGVTGFANTLRSENKLVSAQFQGKDLDFAALALSRFSHAQVIPEDGAKGVVHLKLEQVPFTKAVAQVARQVHRKWAQIYAIQPLHTPVVVREVSAGVVDAPPRSPPAAPPPKTGIQEQVDDPPEQAQEAFLATMSPDERRQAQEQIAAMDQLRSLPANERQQRMQEMGAQARQASEADLLQRIQNRLKNGTPEQRVARDRRLREQQRQGQKP